MAQSDTKRIAKNTLFMYIRMFILLLISLYSSRILLQQLGIQNYGIYNLVGSIIAMFASLRGLFSVSTQRFLNYEMGKNHIGNLQTIFNMSVYLNIIISIIFIVIVEVVGYWFLNYKINIDPNRLIAAKWVFQLSIITSVVMIMTTPYDAVIIANEKLDFFAYISILEGVLKLSIIFLLVYWRGDKLIFYAFLVLCVQLLVRFLNTIYCRSHFPESHFKLIWNKTFFKEMASFASWNFFGNLGYSLCTEGTNMVLNVFGGPIVNAARGITYQIKFAIEMFLNNVTKAVDPFAIKLYAQNCKNKFFNVMYLTMRILFSVYLCISLPCFFYIDFILTFWLGQIPQYSIIFIKIILIQGLFKAFAGPINNLFVTVNKVKYYQIINITTSIISLIISYYLLKFNYSYYSVFILMAITSFLLQIFSIILAKYQCDFNIAVYLKSVIVPSIVTLIICFISSFFIREIFSANSIMISLTGILTIAIATFLLSIFLMLNKSERLLFKNIIRNKNI